MLVAVSILIRRLILKKEHRQVKSGFIIDCKVLRWQLGYSKGYNRSGMYHLMLTDRVKLMDIKENIKTVTIGYYSLTEVRNIVDFLKDQSDSVLTALWTNGL